MKRRISSHINFDNEDVNPMENLANLMDVMLVLAVGLMMALVVAWNVDVFNTTPGKNMEIINKNDKEKEVELNESDLTESGTVYKDSDGNLYMINK